MATNTFAASAEQNKAEQLTKFLIDRDQLAAASNTPVNVVAEGLIRHVTGATDETWKKWSVRCGVYPPGPTVKRMVLEQLRILSELDPAEPF